MRRKFDAGEITLYEYWEEKARFKFCLCDICTTYLRKQDLKNRLLVICFTCVFELNIYQLKNKILQFMLADIGNLSNFCAFINKTL